MDPAPHTEDSAPQPVPATPLPQFATQEAPPQYRVAVRTTVGDFVIQVDRNLAPNGAKRFYNLVQLGYYRDATFFRAIAKFMVQFGIHGDPKVNEAWKNATIPDDPVNVSNTRGTVVFAKSGQKDSATTQMFINLVDNTFLDKMNFSPLGHVVEGMDVVDQIHTGYGEGRPSGAGPTQSRIMSEGDAHLREFPELTRIVDMQLL